MKSGTGEDLQVVNYGIGGFYNLHYDFTVVGDNAFDSMGVGNRIATILFYVINFLIIMTSGVGKFEVILIVLDERCNFWWWDCISGS